MGTAKYACGCYVMRSMFGDREIRLVGHCWQHCGLYSQDKTAREMAAEIATLDHTWRERPQPDYGPGAYV